MNYYIETHFYDRSGLVTSGGKGRDDYFEMLRRCGLECIDIAPMKSGGTFNTASRIRLEFQLAIGWKRALAKAGKGDVLFIHNPPSEKFLNYAGIIKRVRKRGCRIVTIVFDLEYYLKPYIRDNGRIKFLLSMISERSILKNSDRIMVHNDRMKETVAAMGYDPGRITAVGLMDYLRSDEPDTESIMKRTGRSKNIVFCGNLVPEKAGFLSDIPDNIDIDLYGPGFDKTTNHSINYRGIFPSLKIMDVISGSFGLVWDGSSSHTGTGAGGEYLRINSPHKMALYLASGLPVIVWTESAMAETVVKENCGFAVSDLNEIRAVIDSMTYEAYDEMRDNAIRLAGGLRKGIHIRKATETILSDLENEHD